MPETPRCAEVRELIPELAMGVAPGDERAAALAHVAGCAECRARLEEAARVVDELLLLVPEHEPPAGFDARVLAAGRRRPARGRRTLLLAAAAAVLVAVLAAAGGAGVTRWADSDERELAEQYQATLEVADGSYLRAADLTTGAEGEVGHVFAYEGHPSWVFVSVDRAASGRYRVQVVTQDGRAHDVGDCWVREGAGSWGTAVGVPVHAIQAVVLNRADGPTLTARFG